MALLQGQVLISFATLAELSEVLGRKKFLRYVDEQDIRNFLAALTRGAEWVEVRVQIATCRDPKDDKFLEVAVSGNATHIITGDTDLLALNPYHGIQILPPHRFV
jgi:putative PIN family toxin of toxin-antitoxin system